MKIIVNRIEREDVAGFSHDETTVTLLFKTSKKKKFTSKKGWDIVREDRTIKFEKKKR